ncbi:MAG TPA: alpha-2-macroglobulin family protein, partial [Bryobacteraceae bacterium]|nr:alpha-2-macroglobulin family protein [Bryobacteraceae bacterium]
GAPITVSESPLILTAVPEGGKLIPNLENQVFVLASYSDGAPAVAQLQVHAAGNADQNVSTDAGGVAVIKLNAGTGTESLRIDASDSQGSRASATVPLESRGGVDQILLRTERAVYRAGDRMRLHVFSTKTSGSAYVDVVKDGQTILTRDVDLVNGVAELALAVTPELAGTLDVNAYLFGQDARPVADHRLLFVQPADELKIEATADAAAYKPGDDARIQFHVTNARGEGVQAALGVQVVDEAVFALAEKQPGFAKVFFYLEQEAMKPRYEIHSIGMPEIIEPVDRARMEQRDRAARALFSATEMVNPNRFETETGRGVPQAKFFAFTERYQARFVDGAREALSRAYRQDRDLTKAQVQDPWAMPVRIERGSWNPQQSYVIHSAGPDKRFGTPDDLQALAQVQKGRVLDNAGVGTIGLAMEHDRGAFNGLAEIAGSIVDAAGAGIEAGVSVREIATGKTRGARSIADGQFTVAGVPPGIYVVQVSAPGFQTLTRKIELAARDRAVLAVTLPVGSVAEAVAVTGMGAGRRAAGNVMFMQGQMGQRGGFAGGVLGGVVRELNVARLAAPPLPAAALTLKAAGVKDQETEAAPRVRSYFPEALYINPEVLTDGNGRATISIPLADSITTWRMALTASTARGALGSGNSSIKVFQDFFVDLDLPVTLTQGDRVSIPVAGYNYSGARGNINLKLQPADWFSLVNDAAEKNVTVDSGRVGGADFTLEARRIGKFKLTLSAHMAGAANRADIVVREIEVVPNGREQNQVFNGRLESSAQQTVNFPPAAIPDARTVLVRLYPGPLSQLVEGMDSLLRMPFGCFEQTSSATYPNVLALDYMKRTRKLTPEIHAKAEGFIANGYQRLLTFEVPGGGFSWFGQAPANKILTSYGLMEFSDMAKVHDVDSRLIQRTQQWLAAQQQADGSWKPDASFINEGATNRYNSDLLRITAYIGWALGNTGYQGPAVEKARQFVSNRLGNAGELDAYTLAVVANFAVDAGKDREFTHRAVERLLGARTEKDEQAWWTPQETGVYATGASASIETTGLAVQALLKAGEASAVAAKALRYLASKKDASGTWGTTQATIMALRALLLSAEKGSADVQGTVEITLNGQPVKTLNLTADNNDLYHQFVFPRADRNSTVGLRFAGKGGLAYQVVGRYFLPWSEKPENEPLTITLNYDRTRLAQDDIATATAIVKNNLPKAANMVMVDLGIPPGFDLLSEDLQSYQEKSAASKSGRLQKFSLTATQAILYFDSFAPGDTATIKYRLRAKYPIRAKTFQSRVYEYYDPEISSAAKPIQMEVTKR